MKDTKKKEAIREISLLVNYLESRDDKSSGLLDIIDVLKQVYKNLEDAKNPEALLNKLINYIRSVAMQYKIHFPSKEEKLIIDLEVLGQRAGLNGRYMADFSDKSQFYSLLENIPRHN
ncbi:bacteriocin immunity protein [Liquorilactobacillus nagelii]|uniref:bacteriocin immunity protein n=1 Tax=Liquorilactobacillus nagelii TaxID=82688 RepID=UPI00070AFE2A